ncbi:MAG: DUF1697 domain-containing protein [Nitriliruptoraceae bacterium]
MGRCIALLRGINVGGRNKVAMADLRRLCECLGHGEVRTHGQSGNVVFTTDRADTDTLGAEMTARIDDDLGVAPTVVVLSADQLAAVVAGNPFADAAAADPTKVHAAFLSARPSDPSVFDFDPATYAPEEARAGERVLYLHLPGGMGRSQLAADLARRRSDVEVTVRNWRTVTRLHAMAHEE